MLCQEADYQRKDRGALDAAAALDVVARRGRAGDVRGDVRVAGAFGGRVAGVARVVVRAPLARARGRRGQEPEPVVRDDRGDRRADADGDDGPADRLRLCLLYTSPSPRDS